MDMKRNFPSRWVSSCSWDMPLVEKSARIAAQEASADGINWTFSPMVDIARDPRWGRIAEGNGEDPYLGSAIARAMVKGYQGKDLSKNNTIMACVKHYALYGAAEAGRDYNTTDMSRVRMFNEYLPPYKAAVDAGAGSVMASFNEVDGVPATANKFLMTDVLRTQWGFKGFVVTDYTGINEMVAAWNRRSANRLRPGLKGRRRYGHGWRRVSDHPEKVAKGREGYMARDRPGLPPDTGSKIQTGLFEDPYRYCDEQRAADGDLYGRQPEGGARDRRAQSFVLLKNQGNVLPLKKSGTIALVGPLADNRENMVGTWSVAADFEKSVSRDGRPEGAPWAKMRRSFMQGAPIS